ncbi:MAG: hypothetical protein WBV62_11180 [Roseobacter sp.]
MLFKTVLRVALLSFGLVPTGTAAVAADEHIVIILETAYFPQRTTVKQGDVVRFVNESGRDHTLYHAQGNWTTRPIAQGEELLVTIGPDIAGAYYGMSDFKITGQLDLAQPATAD